MTWVNAVIQGILLGGLYALFACGLSTGLGAAIGIALAIVIFALAFGITRIGERGVR